MYQLVLGVGWDALKTRFESYDANPRSVDWKKLDQHKILLNKAIMEYYIKSAEAEGHSRIDSLKQYLGYAFTNKQRSEKANVNGQKIEDIFGNYFRNKSADEVALIYGPTDARCSKNKCRSQFDITEEIFDDKTSVISLHSLENNATLFPGEPAKKYLTFVSHMVSGEKNVNFIDPYIAGNDFSRREFCQRYLPMLASGSTVNVYLDADSYDTHLNEIKQAAENLNLTIHIFCCDKTAMHDRFITTKDAVLTIGAGILFYKNSGNPEIREVSTFNYARKPKSSDAPLEVKLAGNNIRSQFC